MRAAFLCLAASAFLIGQAPDRDARPEEWGYRPADGSTVAVNPPALSWAMTAPGAKYEIEWTRSDSKTPVVVKDVPWSVYTHNRPLEPGTYAWRYRATVNGKPMDWSKPRRFRVPKDATVFPQPSMEEIRARIPKQHPRLFVTPQSLPQLREWAKGGGAAAFARVLSRADALLNAEPTPEPTEMGTISNPNTRQFWWSNRVQTLRACSEAEALAFAYMITREKKYGDAARRWILHLASWNPDGPTNWKLNDEAAMPILHRLPRAYDWAYDTLSEDERAKVRAVMLRRAMDTWNAGQTGKGFGHLNTPYNSHGNRSWHKLAENAIATFGDTPESEQFLHFALSKFFAAYPAWSDDDGGWHEGLSYWAGYMTKVTWWMEIARTALGIDGFKKPFFANFAEYGLYTAPPGSPDMGFGDLSFRPPSSGWAFVHYFARGKGNPYWTWWAEKYGMKAETEEPAMAFLWSAMKPAPAKAPADLPPSKVFQGIGVAVLNTTLLDSADNVQVRFKSSPFGRQSHGHEPHNSFTLNAYGEQLLVNNVYRDFYGSPFHKGWAWSTKSQNAMLVDGEGQKPHSADLGGRIVAAQLDNGLDYIAGDATAGYEGKLKRYIRHVIFVKPDIVIIADEAEAAKPSTFQWMLHGRTKFGVDTSANKLTLEGDKAGVLVEYVTSDDLKYKQWDGYDPAPDKKYLTEVKNAGIPNQWHVEASTSTPAAAAFGITVLRPYRKGAGPTQNVRVERGKSGVTLKAASASGGDVSVTLRQPGSAAGDFAVVRKGSREWKLKAN